MTGVRIYLAARYQERLTMLGWSQLLESDGITVTGRWIHGGHDAAPKQVCATDDLADIDAAEAVVLWNPKDHHGGGSGGRHVEVGYALGTGKPVIVVGEPENVFHWHPDVRVIARFADLAEAVRAVTGRA